MRAAFIGLGIITPGLLEEKEQPVELL
ncbi:MAG: hypothetical protein AVDCRST_MAG93-3721, partial [uncultured Chloroflexia bacterium]